MHCHQYRMQLERAIEAREWPANDLIHHLESCESSDCRTAWSDYLLLESAIVDWQLSSESWGDETDLQPQSSSSARSAGKSRRQWGAIIAMGACLVTLFCLPMINGTGVRPQQNLSNLVSNADSDPIPEPPVATEQTSERSAVAPLLTLEWIGDAPLQVGHSMVSVLLGDEQSPPSSSTGRPGWMEFWPEQLLPIQEEVEAVRELLQGQPDSQSLSPGSASQKITVT